MHVPEIIRRPIGFLKDISSFALGERTEQSLHPAFSRKPRWMLNENLINNESLLDDQFLTHEGAMLELISKASKEIVPSFYDQKEVYIQNKDKEDVTDTMAYRRAIHTISNYYNSLGIYRDDFDRNMNDKLARNAYYSLIEKAIMDYFGSAEWSVKDRITGERVDKAIDFLYQPNPQDSFGDVAKTVMRDLIRYDAGVIVKSFNKGGYINEMKAYMGTEFWREQDRVPMIINVPVQSSVKLDMSRMNAPTYQGWWSHGYTERYWQRSRTGVYIPFQPEEICYFMMYPRTDGIYGTDFLKFLKYQLQYLIDSTKAAGKTFENGIVPSIVWEHPDMRTIPQFRQRIKEAQINNQGWNKFGSVIHTVNGEKVSSLAQTLHDMQWLEGQKFVAQIIWSMWGFSQDEFLGGGSNRATAYVKRNITKSRMLYPLMDYFEGKINREILPHMRGYKKSWRFEYLKDVDLDDQQKIASIYSVKSGTVNTYINMNFPVELALKLAGVGDDLATGDVETIKDAINAAQMRVLQAEVAGTQGTDVMEEPGAGGAGGADEGRYGAGSEGYQPINLSDYGQGAANAKPMTEAKQEQEHSGGAVKKAKVYITHPSEAPKGRSVRRGNRGGYYYMTAEGAGAAPAPGVRSGAVSHGKPGGWGAKPPAPEQTGAPMGGGGGGSAPPQIAGDQITISGENIGVVVAVVEGQLQAEALPTDETNEFLSSVMATVDPADTNKVIEALVAEAEKRGYEVT